MSEYKEHRFYLCYLPNVIIEGFVFLVLAIFFGFLIDSIFNEPKPQETLSTTIFLIIFQVLLDAIVVFYLGELYTLIFHRDPDIFVDITTFGLVFFLVQIQLQNRLNILYTHITGIDL